MVEIYKKGREGEGGWEFPSNKGLVISPLFVDFMYLIHSYF